MPVFGTAERCAVLAAGARHAGADMIELRFDLCAKKITPSFCGQMASRVSRQSPLPKIATFRIHEEGGGEIFSKHSQRGGFFQSAFPYVTFIDVEMAAKDREEIIHAAKKAKKKIIVSVHDLKKMPDESRMDALLREGFSCGADLVKLAFFSKTQMHALRLLAYTLKNNKKGIITVALGENGVFSRVLAGVFGSRILYGHAGKASFAHQLSAGDIARGLEAFGCR